MGVGAGVSLAGICVAAAMVAMLVELGTTGGEFGAWVLGIMRAAVMVALACAATGTAANRREKMKTPPINTITIKNRNTPPRPNNQIQVVCFLAGGGFIMVAVWLGVGVYGAG